MSYTINNEIYLSIAFGFFLNNKTSWVFKAGHLVIKWKQ